MELASVPVAGPSFGETRRGRLSAADAVLRLRQSAQEGSASRSVGDAWWIRVLAVVCGLGVLWALFYYREARQQGQRATLLRLYEEQTAELRAEKEAIAQQADALYLRSQQQQRLFMDLSHETRTPLTLILSPVEQLLQQPALDPSTRRLLELVQRNARRLLYLTDQMLDLARLERGEMRLHPKRIDLCGFVRHIVEAFDPLARERGLLLRASLPSAPLLAVLDPAMLEVVLFNLLGNAVKFTDRGGVVHVQLERAGDDFALRVADTGSGIPPDQVGRIFDRFERGFTHQPGTGIGLALVREIALAHGGTVTVESTVDVGSTFTYCCPLEQPTEQALPVTPYALGADPVALYREASVPAKDDALADRAAVLIADDNAEVRAYLADLLAERYRIFEARDGREALRVAQAELPDLILCDMRMPEMDGLELCRAVKSDPALQFVPVIVLTADASPQRRLRSLEQGADDFLAKPFQAEELRARVHNLLAARRAWRQQLGETPFEQLPYEDAFPDQPSADDALRLRLHEIVHEHFSDGTFSAGMLAEKAGMSPAHLRRKMQDLFFLPPTDYIRRYRLRQAAALLRRRAGSVSEIAYSVGFNSVSYFTRAFREVYGVVPSSYGAPHGTSPPEQQKAPRERETG